MRPISDNPLITRIDTLIEKNTPLPLIAHHVIATAKQDAFHTLQAAIYWAYKHGLQPQELANKLKISLHRLEKWFEGVTSDLPSTRDCARAIQTLKSFASA